MLGIQKLDFSGNNQYIWLMGGGTVTTVGEAPQVDPNSDLVCGAPAMDAGSLSPSFDLDPSQSSILVYGEAPPPITQNFDVLIGCWLLNSLTPPAPTWTHRIGSAPGYGLPSTRQMKNAFLNNLIIQSVTRRRQALVWPGSDGGFSLPEPSLVTDLLNPYIWARQRSTGATQWAFKYTTTTE